MTRISFLVAAAFATALMAHAGEMPDFSDFDTDADGAISSAEFVAHKTATGKVTEEEALLKFTAIDADGDAVVSQAEFDAAVAAWKTKQDKAMPDEMTGDGDDAS